MKLTFGISFITPAFKLSVELKAFITIKQIFLGTGYWVLHKNEQLCHVTDTQ